MTAEILHIMEERPRFKNLHTVEGDKKYKEIKHSMQKLCREAKDKYFNDKCKEIEMLDKCHNQLLYKKVKALQPREQSSTSDQRQNSKGSNAKGRNPREMG